MNSQANDSCPDDVVIDDAAFDDLDAAFDDYREHILFQSGLDELQQILAEEEFRALEQFLVCPIYHLVDCDGEKRPIKHFRQSVENTVKVAAYLHRASSQIASRDADLKRRITRAKRTIYVCIGVIAALFVLVLCLVGT